jgi:hypothetical protein
MLGQNPLEHFCKPKTYWGKKEKSILQGYYQTKEEKNIF